MNSDKSRELVRKAFFIIAGLGLILNVIFDFSAFIKNRESDKLGEGVAKAFQASIHLERLDRLLNKPHDKNSDLMIRGELDYLISQNLSFPTGLSIESLKRQIEDSPQRAAATVLQLRNAMNDEVVLQQNADNAQNSLVDREMMQTLVLDLVLIAAMLVLFSLNVLARKRVEHNLRLSLVNMRESLVNLEEQALKHKVDAKTTLHDLKNPIITIIGFAQLLQDDPSSEMTVMEFSNRIRKISERSLTLVESLLLEVGPGTELNHSVDFVSVVTEICSQLHVQASRKNQSIIREIDLSRAVVFGNSLKLEELISNILSNAIKYSPRGARLKLKMQIAENFVELEIEDQGPGFSSSDKQNAFHFGKKLSAQPTENESSTGFGLYIAKQIVDLHHGEIELLDGISGTGARVVVRLPLASNKIT